MRRRSSLLRRLIATTLSLCAYLAVLLPPARAQPIDAATEYRIKAAYLYNFTKFIEWPYSAFSEAGTPFIVGVLDPAGAASDVVREALRGKRTPGGRAIEVRVFTVMTPEVNVCHQLFITRASGLDPGTAQRTLGKASVLLVGETDGFAEQGGAIGFVVSGDNVHCDVNLAGAQRASVKLSGRLASVARLVRETGRK